MYPLCKSTLIWVSSLQNVHQRYIYLCIFIKLYHIVYYYCLSFKVHYFITSFYEGVLYLGAAYHKAITEGNDISDGYTIARTFFGSTFEGMHVLVHRIM